jgi:hypothetical protein
MDDKEIVKTFLDMGMQITNEAMPIVRKDPEFFIQEIKKLKIRPFFLTKDIANEILSKQKKDEINFKVIKEIVLNKKALKIEDYTNYYLKKYEKIKDIFASSGIPAISINKINENTKNFFTIGIIREKNTSSVTLEDPTGEIKATFEGIMKQKIQEFDVDDVVAIFCERVKDGFTTKKILLPDIPLNREVKKLGFDASLKIGVDENILSPKKHKNPVYVDVSGIVFLILPKSFFDNLKIDFSSEDAIKILKKRFLMPKTLEIALTNPDDLVLSDLPDFIITDAEPSMFRNYKGTTVLSVADKNYEVNLHTREVKEL